MCTILQRCFRGNLFDAVSFYARGGGDSAGGGRLAREKREICLEVSGLRCGSCVSKLERALLSVDGVLEVGSKIMYGPFLAPLPSPPPDCRNHINALDSPAVFSTLARYGRTVTPPPAYRCIQLL